MTQAIHIVFDGPPGPTAGRFIEVETPAGRSINVGEWRDRAGGYWELRITLPIPEARLPHYHVAGTTIGKHIDECAKCGRDLRSDIHRVGA